MRYSIFLCICLMYAAISSGFAQPAPQNPFDPSRSLAVGRWTSRFTRGGLFLDFDGIPLLKGGVTQVFRKDYQQGYYGSGSNPPPTTMERLPDGGFAYTTPFEYKSENQAFHAIQRIEVHPDNTVSFSIKTRWDGPDTALLEWNPARLWSAPLLGAQCEFGTSLLNGFARIDRQPLSGPYPANRIRTPWKRCLLHLAALGDLEFTGTEAEYATEHPVLFDARKDPFLQNDSVFWIGYVGAEMPPGQEQTRTLLMKLTPRNPPPAIRPDQAETAPLEAPPVQTVAIQDALRPLPPLDDTNGHPIIIPQPKQAVFPGGNFALRGRIPVFILLPEDEAGRRARSAARELLAELSRDLGVKWSLQRGAWKGRGLLITLTAIPHPQSSETERGEAGLTSTSAGTIENQKSKIENPEGYTLRVTRESVELVGADAAGAFYGLQTLRQLLRIPYKPSLVPSGKAKRPPAYFTGADIRDWPSLKFRGAHLFVGKNALPFHKKMIERVFSRYKLNYLVIECEYTRWKTHPEIHVPYSMAPEDLREEVAFARDHFMEPIPLINSLGHSEWIFKNGQHLDLAEDVTSPHAYDASNPATYRFIYDIFGEALDIFHPRYFHIGHDEVKVPSYDLFGKYPARPANIQKGATALFMEDTNRLADWLRERGARTILWGDMMLNSAEGDPNAWDVLTAANAPTVEDAQKRRALLPKDAILADWRYDPGSEQRNGLQIFQSGGFTTLACPWLEPLNIYGWAQQAVKNNAWGMLQTTWAGYDSKEELLDEEYRQFTAFVLAAEYSWSGSPLRPYDPSKTRTETIGSKQADAGKLETKPIENKSAKNENPGSLPYDERTVFARSYRGEPFLAMERPGWFLNLRQAANITLFGAGFRDFPWSAYWESKFVPEEDKKAGWMNGNTVNIPLFALKVPQAEDVGTRVIGVGISGLMLNGLLNPTRMAGPTGETTVHYPSGVILPVHARAATLAFLHATGYPVEINVTVGIYIVVYEDGLKVKIPLRYGREIRALEDSAPMSALSADALTVGAQVPITLRLFRWQNPYPEKAIRALEFRASKPYAAPTLFGVTGLPWRD